jgi:hypothetical protein
MRGRQLPASRSWLSRSTAARRRSGSARFPPMRSTTFDPARTRQLTCGYVPPRWPVHARAAASARAGPRGCRSAGSRSAAAAVGVAGGHQRGDGGQAGPPVPVRQQPPKKQPPSSRSPPNGAVLSGLATSSRPTGVSPGLGRPAAQGSHLDGTGSQQAPVRPTAGCAAPAFERRASSAPIARHAALRTRTCEAGRPGTARPGDRRQRCERSSSSWPHQSTRPGARCTPRCTAAEHQRRRSPGSAIRPRSARARTGHPGSQAGPEPPQRGTRGPLKRLVGGLPLAVSGLCAGPVPPPRPEPAAAITTLARRPRRRGRNRRR